MAKTNRKMQPVVMVKVFNDIKSVLWYSDVDNIASKANVHRNTLWNWLYGNTKNPHIKTLIKVAKVLGYDIALRKCAGSKGLHSVK